MTRYGGLILLALNIKIWSIAFACRVGTCEILDYGIKEMRKRAQTKLTKVSESGERTDNYFNFTDNKNMIKSGVEKPSV